jgi:hypothetical protein
LLSHEFLEKTTIVELKNHYSQRSIMMKKHHLISYIFLIRFLSQIAINVHAQDFQKIATTGFVFLELPVTARSVAKGETGITMTDAAAEGLFNNPLR